MMTWRCCATQALPVESTTSRGWLKHRQIQHGYHVRLSRTRCKQGHLSVESLSASQRRVNICRSMHGSTSDKHSACEIEESLMNSRRQSLMMNLCFGILLRAMQSSPKAEAKLLSLPDVYFLEPTRNASVASPILLRMSTKSNLRIIKRSDSGSSDIDADANKLGEDDVPGEHDDNNLYYMCSDVSLKWCPKGRREDEKRSIV